VPRVIAQARRGRDLPAAVGDLVLVQRQRAHGRRSASAGRSQILRLIGRPDVARDVIEALMLERGLTRGFDPAVEREAREVSKAGGVSQARRDLRGLATFTIDPHGARDYDDAISAERLGDGTARVWVHIADVSAYVREGSALDREAHRRATSVYVPGAVEPMLPPALSNEACSLIPGADRLALTVEMDLDGAAVKRVAFHRSIIRSDARLTYEQVDAIFAGAEAAGEPWGSALAIAREVAAALQDARLRRGALTLDSPEPEFSFDPDGNVGDIQIRQQTESHRVIEHLMIAANEAVARMLEQHKTPCLYRVHERPDPERVARLVEQLAALEVPTPPLPEHMSSSQAAELLGEISQQVERHIERVLARASAAGSQAPLSGGRLALTSLVLRSLKQAYYSPRNIGHAGLSSSCYCHFTSPIRRYPDLVCHRALLRAIGQDGELRRSVSLVELGEWTSERERYAMTIERDADDVARCFSLQQLLYREGWEQTFAGEITGLISAGAFIAFAPAAQGLTSAPQVGVYEGMLAVRRLSGTSGGGPAQKAGVSAGRSHRHLQTPTQTYAGREWWELDEHSTTLRASRSGAALRLGDPIEVQVVGVEPARGRVDLAPGG
jgi:ribonuclease R